MNTTLESEGTRAPVQRASVWEDFADIFFEPSSVFARRRDGGFAVAFVVLTIVIGALSWAWVGAMEPVFAEQFSQGLQQVQAQNPNMTAEQIASARGMMMTVGKISALFSLPIIVLLTGFGIWLLGKLFDADAPFKTSLMIATFAQFPRVLKLAVETVQATIFDPSRIDSMYAMSLSPARFLDPDEVGQLVLGIAGRFDIFIIWMTVLIGLGVLVAGRTTKRNATIIAVLIWVIGGLFAIGGALRQGG